MKESNKSKSNDKKKTKYKSTKDIQGFQITEPASVPLQKKPVQEKTKKRGYFKSIQRGK